LHGVDAHGRDGGRSPLAMRMTDMASVCRRGGLRECGKPALTKPAARDADYKERCTFPASNPHHQADPSGTSYIHHARQVHCSWVDHSPHIEIVVALVFFSSLTNLCVEVVAALAERLQFLEPDLLQQGQFIVKIKVRIV